MLANPNIQETAPQKETTAALYDKNFKAIKDIVDNVTTAPDKAEEIQWLLDANFKTELENDYKTEDGKKDIIALQASIQNICNDETLINTDGQAALTYLDNMITTLTAEKTTTKTTEGAAYTDLTTKETGTDLSYNSKEGYGKDKITAAKKTLDTYKDKMDTTDYTKIKTILDKPNKENIQSLQGLIYKNLPADPATTKSDFIKANKIGKVETGDRDGMFGPSTSKGFEALLAAYKKTSSSEEKPNEIYTSAVSSSNDAITKESDKDAEAKAKLISEAEDLLVGTENITYDADHNVFVYNGHSISRDKIWTKKDQISLAEFQKQIDAEHPVEGVRVSGDKKVVQKTKIKNEEEGKEGYKTKTYTNLDTDAKFEVASKETHKHRGEDFSKTVTKDYTEGDKNVTKVKEGKDRFENTGDKTTLTPENTEEMSEITMTADEVTQALQTYLKEIDTKTTTNTLLKNYEFKIKDNGKVDISPIDKNTTIPKDEFTKAFDEILVGAGITSLDIKNYKMDGSKTDTKQAVTEYTFKIDWGAWEKLVPETKINVETTDLPNKLKTIKDYGTWQKDWETYVMTPITSVPVSSLSKTLTDNLFVLNNSGFDVKYMTENDNVANNIISINITPKTKKEIKEAKKDAKLDKMIAKSDEKEEKKDAKVNKTIEENPVINTNSLWDYEKIAPNTNWSMPS